MGDEDLEDLNFMGDGSSFMGVTIHGWEMTLLLVTIQSPLRITSSKFYSS